MSDTPKQQKPSDGSSWMLLVIFVSSVLRVTLGILGFPDEARWGVAYFLGVLLLFLSPSVRQRFRFWGWLWISFSVGTFVAGLWHFLNALFPHQFPHRFD
jgi:apolipoprotein N-acyltransferase